MAVQVRIPSPLVSLTNNQSEVTANGSSIKEVLEDLEKQFSGLKERLFDDGGSLRRFINIYLNEEDIRFLDGENTKINDGDEISIIPAIAGGR
jgi:sulfur-carrier protein